MQLLRKIQIGSALIITLNIIGFIQDRDYEGLISTGADVLHKSLSISTYNLFHKDVTIDNSSWQRVSIQYLPEKRKYKITAYKHKDEQVVAIVKQDIETMSKQYDIFPSEKAIKANTKLMSDGKFILHLSKWKMLSVLEHPIDEYALLLMKQKTAFKGYKIEYTPELYTYMITYKDKTPDKLISDIKKIN